MLKMGWVKPAWACLLILQLIFAGSVYASSSVSVTIKQRLIVAQQRGIVTLPFTVINQGTEALTLHEKVDLPDGWRILAERGAFTLAAGERTVRLVHLLASGDVPAGKYTIPYYVISRDQLAVRAEENIDVVIHSTSRLTLDTIEKPELVLAGEEYAVKVRAENKGNAPLALAVNVRDPSAYLTSVEPRHLQLAPSESAIITIKSAVPAGLKKSLTHTVKLSLQGKSVAEDKNIVTQIIARIPEGTGLYHTLPTSITSHYTDDGSRSGLQAEFTARGSIDEQGKHFIDLLYQDTRESTSSSLGSNSEQRVTYQYNAISIHLGDRTFPVAGITDNGFYGRGFEAGYHPVNQNWAVRGFSVAQHPEDDNDPDSDSQTEMQGFEISYQYSDSLALAFNMINSDDADNSQKNELLTGFEVYWDKYEAAEINFSMAQDKDGDAFRFEQNGRLGALSYDLEIERADGTFDGRINDVERQSFTGIYHINDKQSYFRTNLFHSKNNLSKDITRRISEENNISLGFGHYFEENIQDSLYTELFARTLEDKREASDLYSSEQGIRIDYQKSINQNLSLNTIIEYAQQDDKINREISDKLRGSLTLAYVPSDKYHFGFNIDSLQTDDDPEDTPENHLSYGLNAAVNFSPGQRLSGYWRHSENSGSSSQNLHISYHHTFRSGMTLGASVSTDLQQDDTNELSYRLSLSVPFDVPLYKYKNIGSVTGKIIDRPSRKPIPDTVVGIAGQYAVTDENGNYRFKAVREGKYNVTTDLSRTSYSNYFLEDAEYREVVLIANQATEHNIALAPGTGVSGQVLNHTVHHTAAIKDTTAMQNSVIDNNAGLQPAGGIGGLLVTLVSHEDDAKEYKTLTNEGGYFYFNGVKAGQWRIQVSDPDNLIKEARLEESQRTIELNIGEDKKVTFNAIPLIKKIKKIGPSSGFNVSGE